MRNKLARIGATLIGAALVAGAVTPAYAADATDATVSGGTLTIDTVTVGNFSTVTLDGTAKTATATMDNFGVTDSRGTGAGWNVTVGATQFKEWDSTLNAGAGGYVTSGKTLATSSLSMPQPTVAKTDSTSSAVPTITTGPYTIDSGSAVKIAAAAADGTGMGSYTFTQGGSLSLSIPASAYAKTYRSEATVSVNSGP